MSQILGTIFGTLIKKKFRKSFGSLITMGLINMNTYVIMLRHHHVARYENDRY